MVDVIGNGVLSQAIPGVPSLFGGAALLFPTLMTGDTIGGGAFGTDFAWGVFKGGSPVIIAETCVSIDYRQTWNLSDYPVERGGFESYNKVYTPFEPRVRFASGGNEARRAALLQSIAAIAGDLNLYDVVTPEVVYRSVNVKHYDYHRTAVNGVGMITVDVWLEEVRVTVGEASTTTSGTQAGAGGDVITPPVSPEVVAPVDPSGFNPSNNGVTNPVPGGTGFIGGGGGGGGF